MHSLASAIVPFFLSPFNWILILVVMRFFIRSVKGKRFCKIAALFIFILFSNQWILNSYARFWQPEPRDISNDKPYSCGILLGGFANPDENGNGYFNSAAERFLQAVKLYKQGKIQHILISGGNGKKDDKDFSEASWAKSKMEKMGIPGSDILCEDKSENTADNAIYTKRLLDSASLQPPYLLITTASHIPRASLIFKTAGIQTVPFPCNYLAGRGGFSFLGIIPQPSVLFTWNFYIKETAGYLLYELKAKL